MTAFVMSEVAPGVDSTFEDFDPHDWTAAWLCRERDRRNTGRSQFPGRHGRNDHRYTPCWSDQR